jgi:protein SCO1
VAVRRRFCGQAWQVWGVALGAVLAVCAASGSAARADPFPPLQAEVGFDQKLGEAVPLDLAFRDEDGQAVRLGDLLTGAPVILTLNYLRCPNFCTLVMDGVAERLDEVGLEAGREYRIVTVSIDPREGPQEATAQKALLARHYPAVANAGAWHFLTGDAEAVKALAAAVGFRYAYDPLSDEFAHPAGLIVLTPQAKIARYLYGVDFHPRDLRLALVEAASNRIGTPVDQFLLRCFHYDPATGRYSLAVLNLVRAAAALTVLGLGAGLVWLRRHEARPVAGG